ncbi:MAG: DUF2961 domain-containing protein [Bacteroidota bacterium]|nr:DUF2961 domain-containing protein [Bacteroidota bacterium]MDP4233538.1 DUF2961 domain-containing protein [Bacteroidota bacterium]MDP4244037.1 DUF2961 domain-containing protein [Bacteroidota bacterium]MDP4287724.1 DUF2961 domain-containing protein [Bacteroidota bacterium]
MLFRVYLVVALMSFAAFDVNAQTLDPYRRINEPLAIADLGGPDSGSILRTLVGRYDGPKDLDGYVILAGDTGAGILRHLWAVYPNGIIPPRTRMKLWVDDSVLIEGTTTEFFTSLHGLIGPPFDTASAGAEVLETQIPYRHNFRWTHDGEWPIRNAEWQHIDANQLPRLGSNEFDGYLKAADANYWRSNPWPSGRSVSFLTKVAAGDTLILANLRGPGYIQNIHFHFDALDTALLQRLRFSIHWDNCPAPSVDLPLADLFGIALGAHPVHAFRILVDSANGTLDLSFPMPFKVNALISITNGNSTSVQLDGNIAYRDTIWNSSLGYFSTQYHVTTDIPYTVFHPLLHTKGTGRYVGAIFNFPNAHLASPNFMEGDGYLMVDSLPYDVRGASLHYTGTEDYCDGGWYYLDTSQAQPPIPPPSFSYPFRGCPNWCYTMYRFHINAPYNYAKSMDIDFGHGFREDYTQTYRTTAFYYQRWTPFYDSNDTITAGNQWTITGAGFTPDTALVLMLDADTIYRGKSQADGSILIRLMVPSNWRISDHTLSLNGIVKPEPITVLGAPKLFYIQDTAGRVFGERDSIELRAYGFLSHERLSLLLGDTLFQQMPSIMADSDGVVRLKTHLPWVPQGRYSVRMLRATGASVIADSTLFVTRTLNFEFEMLPVIEGKDEATYSYISLSGKHWSQGTIEFCYSYHERGKVFAFQFAVPFADTFSTTVFSTIGDRYGIYRTYIDSTDLGSHDWFLDVPWGTIYRDSTILPNIYLAAGTHTIRFVNEGWDDSAVESSFGPDNFTLRPLSGSADYFQGVAPLTASESLAIFPNPLDQLSLSVAGLPDALGSVPAVLYNAIGQEVLRTILLSGPRQRTFTVPQLPNGSYRLAIELPSGRSVIPLALQR